MNRQFPCILKGFYTYFVFDKGSAIPLDENCISNIDEINFNDKVFKNITAEYLANTYGEVKSKDHAEFIKLLAETNHMPCDALSIDMNYKFFYVIEGCLFFCVKEIDAVGDYKQITIPLPPECEERKPKEVIANGKKHTLNLVTGFYDFCVVELGYASGSTLEKLQEAGDYQVLSFVDECDGSTDGEWPKVGDKVLISDDVQLYESYGFKGKTCKVIGICESEGKKVLTLEHESLGLVAFNMGEWIKKPKTPEQELRDFISLLWDENNHDFDMFLDIVTEHVIKKPQ